jgi:hypothetical protein
MPKINVRPLATRNNVKPYWTPFKTCIRKVAKSITLRILLLVVTVADKKIPDKARIGYVVSLSNFTLES